MIWAVGIGPGDTELLTVKARRLIESADVVAGFGTVLGAIGGLARGEVITLTYANQTAALARVGAAHRAGRRCVVCFMGDPNVAGAQLLARVEAVGEVTEIVSGISSVQVAASRSRVPLDRAVVVVFHRRGDIDDDKRFLVGALAAGRAAFVLPRPWDFMPDDIARFLLASGTTPETEVTVYERLTDAEGSWTGALAALADGRRSFGDMTVVLIKPRQRSA